MKQFTNPNFTLTVFNSAESSFLVTATLVEKDGKAALINGKFTRTDAQEIVTYLRDNNLELEKIYAIHGDPDYYFGAESIIKAFPEAVLYASEYSVEHILHSVAGKLKVWGPQLGQDAPSNIVLPQVYSQSTIELAGVTFDIIGDDAHRINLYNAENKVLIGGIDVFNEIHIFLADTSTEADLQAWAQRLNSLLALELDLVIPSHAGPDGSYDRKALEATRDYLFEVLEVLGSAQDSATFINAMTEKHPSYLNKNVLALGAKVLTGEMNWG